MSEVIVRLKGDRIRVKGGEYVQDLVRCGECRHNGSYDTDCPVGWRNGEWNMPKLDGFCSYGERGDDE